jgi:hypothetical protein
MLHSNELCCTLSELRCALISRNKCICSGPNSGCQAHISLHCTTETYIEKPREINIMSPAPPIAAALILTALLLIEKTPRKCQFGKKSAKVNHSLYSSTEQLQVALRTYIFLWFGLNKEKSIHTLPLRSVPFLSLHL